MKPGETSLPRAAMRVSAAPVHAGPACTIRSPSNTTLPCSWTSWLLPFHATTQPPSITVRMATPSRPSMLARPRADPQSGASASSGFRNEADAVRAVLQFPAEPLDLGPKTIGFGVVPAGPGRPTRLDEAERVGWGHRTGRVDREPEHAQAAREEIELTGGAPAVENREGPGRVEVVVERVGETVPGEIARSRRGDAEGPAEVVGLGARRLHGVVGVLKRAPVMPAEEEDEDGLAPPSIERLAERDNIADGLRHLLGAELDHPVVHPGAGERAPGAAGLSELVLVMGKAQVESAAVDVEPHAQVLF